MPTSSVDFDANTLNEQINILLAKLPGDSPLVHRVKGSVKTLNADIYEVITYLDSKERLQKIGQIVTSWGSRASSEDPHFLLQQIKDILEGTNHSSDPKASSTEIASPIEDNVVPAQVNLVETPPPDQKQEEPPSTKRRGRKSSSPRAKTEDDYRQFGWELVNRSGNVNAVERIIQREIGNWDAKPYPSPQPGDIVLHGTAFTSHTEFPPVWIGAVQDIARLAKVVSQLPYLKPDGQIWLSFAELDSESSHVPHLEKPQWCLGHANTLPLWYRWHDLLWWTLLAPDAEVFVHNKLEKLSEQREAICQTLLDHHKSFVAVLNKQDEYYISRNLHRVYSCFFQFLSPDDLNANEIPQHPFYRLRRAVEDDVKEWMQALQIQELHTAGVLTAVEYLGNVGKETDKNTSLSTTHSFWKNRRPPEESQVLYWLRPRWKLKNTPQKLDAELLGSVLYCFG